MDKKQIFIGMLQGFAANTIGLFTVGLLMAKFSDRSDRVYDVLQAAGSENFIGKLISLGAIMNLLVFFLLSKKTARYQSCRCFGSDCPDCAFYFSNQTLK